MIQASYKPHTLRFKTPGGTSRGVLKTKDTYFLILNTKNKRGIGEAALFRGLSADDQPGYEEKLKWTCQNIGLGQEKLLDELSEYPSIQFGLETAFKSLESENQFNLFPSRFSRGEDAIAINGLIWMGSETFMKQQIQEKIEAGFRCIKMKIGAIDFQTEIGLIKSIRKEFSSKDIELRVDANGAFLPKEALEKLKILSDFDLHSIEQPIKQGQIEQMAALCQETPLPIALDEELIGIFSMEEKQKLLQTIKPQYVILKPSLIGGFKGSDEWIGLAESYNVGWWITSALESNIGLNAIAQYTYNKQNPMPQGLGTGGLFTNNIDGPLQVKKGKLWHQKNGVWNLGNIKIKE